jgi:putative DNA primase/helicase
MQLPNDNDRTLNANPAAVVDQTVVPATESTATTIPGAAVVAPGASFEITAPLWNDLGNAERFVRISHGDVRYIVDREQWIIWRGAEGRWVVDNRRRIRRIAKGVVKAMLDGASSLPEEKREKFRRFAIESGNKHKLLAMIEFAASEQMPDALRTEIAIDMASLDSDPFLLGIRPRNGGEGCVLDLRTGEPRSANKVDLITKQSSVAYDPSATCSRWLQFLAEVFPGPRGEGDVKMIRWMQMAVGYTLTGSTAEQVFFVLFGLGANGKSVFLETLRALMGHYADDASFHSFVDDPKRSEVRNDIAKLAGARFVTASEGKRSAKLDEAVIQRLTGGDAVTARFLYKEEFSYHPQFKLWMATNFRPVIQGVHDGIWRRVILIPFTRTFQGGADDVRLSEHLHAELPGILNWAIQGCLMWQREGLKSHIPSAIRDVTSSYRREMDPMGSFIGDCCSTGPKLIVAARDLYSAYAAWCEQTHESAATETAFGRALSERGFAGERRAQVRVRLGIALHEADLDVPLVAA